MAIRQINSVNDVKGLVRDLTDKNRTKPICLISTEFNSTKSAFDLDELKQEIGHIAELVLIPTGAATFELANNLAPGLQVFGGAARVYPINFNLNTSEHIPLIYPDKNGTKALVSQVWSSANIQALKREQVKNARMDVATVKQVFAFDDQSRAVVEFSDGSRSTIRQELSFPNIPFDWMFKIGDKISGLNDVGSASFVPTFRFTKASELLAEYELEKLIPVLVTKVERKRATCCLFPGIEIEITLPEISGNELDLVSDFLVSGDVLAMRLYKNAQGKISLRMNDIDDDETCVQAVSILDSGEPWLIEGRDVPKGSQPESQPVPHVTVATSIAQYLDSPEIEVSIPKPKPGSYSPPVTPIPSKPMTGKERSDLEFEIKVHKDRIVFLTGSIEALGNERDGLSAELSRALNDLAGKRDEITQLKQTATSLRRAGAKQQVNKSTVLSRRDRFSSDSDWFNEELRRVWISTYSPTERVERYPLDPEKLDYGSRFFESLKITQCTDNDLKKVLRCALDIVTGRESVDARHQVHPIRNGAGASSQDIVAEDGSIALRAYVEEKTAAAKRLHYWVSPSKRITLERVVIHDDFKP